MRILPLLLLLSLFAVSCGDAADTAKTAAADAKAEMSDMASKVDDTMATEKAETANFLQTTVQAVTAVGGDITALAPEAAANNVNGWITKLSQFEGTDAVVDDLAALKKEFLKGGDLDGKAISGILGSMATNTRAVSDKAPGLGTLADVLEAGSKKLGGM